MAESCKGLRHFYVRTPFFLVSPGGFRHFWFFPRIFMAEQAIETEGTIVAVLAGTMFRVELDNAQKSLVLAHISGKMRKRFIRLTLGDRVRLEMSPYDLTKARITYRMR